MRLQQWKSNGWLQVHQTTPNQITDLLAIVIFLQTGSSASPQTRLFNFAIQQRKT
jgi:hypothetical protein